MSSTVNRRNFLKNSAAFWALTAFPLDLINLENNYKVGLIGTGWYGKSDLFRLIQVAPVEVVAICDPDQHLLDEAATLIKGRQANKKEPLKYRNYKDMLSKHKFDIMLVGTPDHWHARITVDCLKAGCHVYVQKPISVDVLEGEAMVKAARKYNRVVQVGTQRKSTPHLIEAKKQFIDTGKLGKISHVDMCCYYHMRANGNPPVQEVPEFFDYNLWSGPAPFRPYDGLPHIRWWRTFMEYGNGIIGDMCVHMLDTARWMLDLKWPTKISSEGGIYVQKEGKSNISDTQTAVFEYPELNCVWQHRSWGTAPDPDYPWALFIYGEHGTLKASTMRFDFIPTDNKQPSIHGDVVYEKEKYPEDLTEERIELNAAPATRLHMIDFLNAIKDSKKPIADIEEGHISTASCILANISMKLNRPLSYDPITRTIPGDEEATKLLYRAYNNGYMHPYDELFP